MDAVPCVFYNTLDEPVKKDDFKYFYVVDERKDRLSLYGVRTYYYQHPDGPVYLSVDESECILREVKPNTPEWATLYLLKQAQNNVKSTQFYKEFRNETE